VTSIQQGTARAAAEAILGFALAAVVLATSPAEAFGIGDVISDFLYNREALVADGAQPRPTGNYARFSWIRGRSSSFRSWPKGRRQCAA